MTDDQTAAALRALARDGERAKQRMDLLFERIDKAQGSADSANRAVARLSKVVGAQGEPEQAKPPAANRPQTVQRTPSPMSWLTTTDEDAARQELAALIEWCRDVYLRYREADLVECWYWHPAVVAELLALRTAWIEAYEGESPSPTAAVDWHDRHRTGVVRRVNATRRPGRRSSRLVGEHTRSDGGTFTYPGDARRSSGGPSRRRRREIREALTDAVGIAGPLDRIPHR